MSLLNFWYRIAYTLWSPFYDLLVGGFGRQRRRSMELAAIKPGERVLIVGAGTGLDLKYIQPDARITAIDLTEAMLHKLRRRARAMNLDVDARRMNAQAMDLPSGSFDVIILHLILAVIPDPKACAMECARVLRPGGRAVILDKFVADDRPVPLPLRLLNPIAKSIATDITRKLGPILQGTGLRVTHQEPAGMGGFMKIVVVEKVA